MREAWKEWEGRVVNKEFRLGEYLGGSERARVFLTQYGSDLRKAAVKLIPIETWDEATVEAELARLQSARELSHPHLLQIFQAGRTNLEDSEQIFVVMEYAEEDLSQILPNRALAAAEVREMLKPILDALGYLHGKGLVHGHLTPANVMATDDQVKLSSDGISRSGERRGAAGQSSEYDAPEVARGENSAASDVWSLGMLVVTALTQRAPGLDASGRPVLRGNEPAPFSEIVRHCLCHDTSARWSLAEFAARLGFESPAEAATPAYAKAARAGQPEAGVAPAEMRRSPAAPRAAAGPQSTTAPQRAVPPPRDFPYQHRSNTGAYVAAAVVLLILGIFAAPRMFRRGSRSSEKGNSQANSQTAGGTSSATSRGKPRAAGRAARATSGIAQAGDQGGSGAALSTANSQANLQPAGEKADLPASQEKTTRRRLTAGQVAEQVVPDVPQSARDTIHGTVRVAVRISVDSSGNVTDAELDNPGPSKYFARLALDAAQQWKFDPPKVAGRSVLSDWLLHFQFREEGTKVIPVQSDP